MTSLINPELTASTAKLTRTDAAKWQLLVAVNVDARRAVQTRRRTAAVGGRRPSLVVDTVATSAGRGAELAERTAVAARTAARELIDAVNAESAVETGSAQRLAVVDVHVAPASGVAGRADAPETIAFVDTATYVVQRTATYHKTLNVRLAFIPRMWRAKQNSEIKGREYRYYTVQRL